MAQYDSKIIYEFANALYRRAAGLVIFYTVVFAILPLVAAYFYDQFTGYLYTGEIRGVATVLTILSAAMGYVHGRAKAFQLKLTAQSALCQVEDRREHAKGSNKWRS